MPILSCRVCACTFEAKTDRKMYCSTRCKDRGKPSVRGLSCYVCGESMVKGSTSSPQGEAAHNRCLSGVESSYGEHGHGGYGRGCRCDTCRSVKGAAQSRLAKRFAEQHGYWPGKRWISRERRMALYERDAWTCLICQTAVDPTAHYLDHASPTLDHIAPVSTSAVPDHSDENLRTAHRICNAIRSDRLDITDAEVASRAREFL